MFNKLQEVRNNVTKENGSYTFQLDVKSESFDREAIRSDDDDANRIAVDAIVQSLAILYYLTPEYTRWRHKNNR